MTVSADVVKEWLESFGRVWRERDAKGAAAIFTEDACYRNTPFLEEPFVGHEAIEGFWEVAVADVADVDFRYGVPVIEGDRVGVEWWTILQSGGEEYTLAGNFLLTFEGDRVSDLRESFVKQKGARRPHLGWGL
ncbi:nuclear transport factor 2 family protein [Saccharopolyspora sp. ASAGF58]|uniref:nuclear transport factor 2 family protein n=1 Tax=Saccharopolyspora sp. ASAGF58 TaxID=2719023 RepID=UPI00143FD022|nr:nuclear transport factor 2 family protein [Saccharopolyspora sp. ASAGF58]QIZ39094.1 nuclear transport factor 2 family protein [Saccharopolyspora sp. ASAGF58]